VANLILELAGAELPLFSESDLPLDDEGGVTLLRDPEGEGNLPLSTDDHEPLLLLDGGDTAAAAPLLGLDPATLDGLATLSADSSSVPLTDLLVSSMLVSASLVSSSASPRKFSLKLLP